MSKVNSAFARLPPLLLPILGAILAIDRVSCAPSRPSQLLAAGPYHRSFLPYARPLMSASPPFSSYPRRYDPSEPGLLQQLQQQYYRYYDKRSSYDAAGDTSDGLSTTQRETRSSPLQGTMRFGKRTESQMQQANAGSGPLGTMRFGRSISAQAPLGTMRFGRSIAAQAPLGTMRFGK